MIKLVLYITGLCGLVNFPNTGGRAASDIVLVNARLDAQHGVPAHTARLRVDSGRVTGGNSLPALGQHIVTIHCGDGTSADRSAALNRVQDDGDRPWRGLRWMADMANVAPDATTRSDYMTGADGHVSATVRLTKGTLQGAIPSSGNFRNVWSVGGVKTAITDRIAYTLECTTPSVEFHLLPFSGGDPVVVKVRPRAGSTMIVATISNLPSTPMTGRVTIGQALPHIEAFYPLMQGSTIAKKASILADCDERGTCSDPPLCPFVHLLDLLNSPLVPPTPMPYADDFIR